MTSPIVITTGDPAPRVLFVGAVAEGRKVLEALLDAGEHIHALVTVLDEMRADISGAVPFDDLAARHGFPLLKVRDINHPANVERIRALEPDLIIVVGWTRLLGKDLLSIPRLGAVGFHASLLPRYRGRAPINWALINGERATGNTMIFLDAGVDTGDIIDQRSFPILDGDTCATLYEKVSASGTDMLLAQLPALKEGRAPRRKQDNAESTTMPKRTPADGVIDWRATARELYNWVRALTHPYPGAFTFLADQKVYVWEAAIASGVAAAPGELAGIVSGQGFLVGTGGGGALLVTRAQMEGSPELGGAELVAGRSWRVGLMFRMPRVS